MKVETDLEYVEVDGDYGSSEGVRVTCSKCRQTAESAGTSDASLKRCGALLRETCLLDEDNFYITD